MSKQSKKVSAKKRTKAAKLAAKKAATLPRRSHSKKSALLKLFPEGIQVDVNLVLKEVVIAKIKEYKKDALQIIKEDTKTINDTSPLMEKLNPIVARLKSILDKHAIYLSDDFMQNLQDELPDVSYYQQSIARMQARVQLCDEALAELKAK